jgi:hypothetical protein
VAKVPKRAFGSLKIESDRTRIITRLSLIPWYQWHNARWERGSSGGRFLGVMFDDPTSRIVMLRTHAERLWRLSTDQAKNVSFETRRELARIADELDDMADRLSRQEAPTPQ